MIGGKTNMERAGFHPPGIARRSSTLLVGALLITVTISLIPAFAQQPGPRFVTLHRFSGIQGYFVRH
jgi:hypothetical protein